MNPAEYFDELVAPAIADFEVSPANIPRAYAVCLFAWHFADAVRVHDGPYLNRNARNAAFKTITNDIAAPAKPREAFWVVAGIANMAKHLELHDPALPVKPKPNDTHVGGEAAFSDGTFWSDGMSWSDAEEVVRTRDDQRNLIDVRWCVRVTRHATEAYLTNRPELGRPRASHRPNDQDTSS